MNERMGFFTDTSVCIGCKACEVACKEWNDVPEDGLNLLGHSYDNTGALSADTWRHVAFIEQRIDPTFDAGNTTARTRRPEAPWTEPVPEALAGRPGAPDGAAGGVRWLMSSDVCKHCSSAACLEVCPTGALFRTEFGTVVVQADVCNGCGACVPACPFGVIDQRAGDGRVWKCTLCYDRLKGGLEPACATACPTNSIQFGPLAELRKTATDRLGVLQTRGAASAHLYGDDPDNGVSGFGAFFLLLDEPEVYGLPPDPVSATRDVKKFWLSAGGAGLALMGVMAASFVKADS